MRKYIYNEKLKILETRASGIITIEDLLDHYKKLGEIDSLPKRLKVLIDCRDVQLDISPDEFKLFIDVLKNSLERYDYIKEAILVNRPHETAVATLFQGSIDFKKYSFKVFSIEENAISWLG